MALRYSEVTALSEDKIGYRNAVLARQNLDPSTLA